MTRDLEMRHLVALDAVARTGTFGRAAEELGYTQSAVSQQIAAFERLLGAPLFDRPGGPRRVTLTPLGERVLEHARELLGRVGAAASDLDQFRQGSSGTLAVGTFESMATSLLPMVVGALLAERPKLEISLFESDDSDVLERWVREGQTDVTFAVRHGPDADDLTSVSLLTDPYVVVTPPEQHRDEPFPATDLVGLPIIGDRDSTCERIVMTGLQSIGITPNHVFRSGNNNAIVAMVRAGLGVAVMPRLALDANEQRVSVRPLDPPVLQREICLKWRSGRTLAPATERFMELTRKIATDFANSLT